MPEETRNIFQIHETGQGLLHLTTRHSRLYRCCVHANVWRRFPQFRNNRNKKIRRQTVFLSFSFNPPGNGKPQPHAPGQTCRKTKTNKLKSTSEVTLQDSNLEVYWQRGRRPGLVHGRDTLPEHPRPPLGTGTTVADRRAVTLGDHYIPMPRLASSDISLFRNLYLLEQIDTLLFF